MTPGLRDCLVSRDRTCDHGCVACLSSSLRCLIPLCLVSALAAQLPQHGLFEKPFYNDKTNYATRGGAGGQETTLYMMEPKPHMTGLHDTVGWTLTVQDEDASTPENLTFQFVRYASNGNDPDASKTIYKTTWPLFGLGDSGVKAYSFRVTFGLPQSLPRNYGVGITLQARSNWPKDGASVHGQLNIANDSRRPRVPAPFDKQVWAFEMPKNTTKPVALGGRTLDTLAMTTLHIEPVMRVMNVSSAYGLGTETLYGPEAQHPVASRGDQIGFFLNGGMIAVQGIGVLFLAPALATNPVPLPRGEWELPLTPPWPYPAFVLNLDGLGQGTVPALPFSSFPVGFRSFWAQFLVVNPITSEFEISEAMGVYGK